MTNLLQNGPKRVQTEVRIRTLDNFRQNTQRSLEAQRNTEMCGFSNKQLFLPLNLTKKILSSRGDRNEDIFIRPKISGLINTTRTVTFQSGGDTRPISRERYV